MLHYLYEQLLVAQISKSSVPGCVAIVLNPGDLDARGLEIVRKLIGWCETLGIQNLALYAAGEDTQEAHDTISSELSDAHAGICLHTKGGVSMLGRGGDVKLLISLGFGGRREVAEAIIKLLKDVERGRIDPNDIDEFTIEASLRFSQKPDLVIRAGGRQLSDFMIWQAAYSELYFTDVNWSSLRKTDFLRAIRDYQRRERRYGR